MEHCCIPLGLAERRVCRVLGVPRSTQRYQRQPPDDVLFRLAELFVHRGVPQHIRSDNGPEFAAMAVREWLHRVGVQTLFITPGRPCDNGYVESVNGLSRDERLNRELADTLWEVQVLVERWRQTYNQIRPHSALGYRPPAPEGVAPCCA